MTRILLVRHGQSEWNEAGLWQGQADPPLTDLGRRQARTAALAVGTVDLICASTLDRARETAQLIADSIGVGPVLELDGVIERDAGEWSGLTRAEIEHRYPGYLSDGRRPPGWEPDDDLIARVMGTLDALVGSFAGSEVVMVTHGGVIMAVEEFLGAGRHRIANLGGRWIDSDGDGTGFRLGDRLDLLDGHDVTIPDQI